MSATNPGPAWAVGLAAAALLVLLATIAVGGALQAGLAPWPGLAIIVLAVAAFALSRQWPSFLVAGLLAATGLVSAVYGLVQTGCLAAATFPGPIFGIIIGLPVLGLGVAKAFERPRPGG